MSAFSFDTNAQITDCRTKSPSIANGVISFGDIGTLDLGTAGVSETSPLASESAVTRTASSAAWSTAATVGEGTGDFAPGTGSRDNMPGTGNGNATFVILQGAVICGINSGTGTCENMPGTSSAMCVILPGTVIGGIDIGTGTCSNMPGTGNAMCVILQGTIPGTIEGSISPGTGNSNFSTTAGTTILPGSSTCNNMPGTIIGTNSVMPGTNTSSITAGTTILPSSSTRNKQPGTITGTTSVMPGTSTSITTAGPTIFPTSTSAIVIDEENLHLYTPEYLAMYTHYARLEAQKSALEAQRAARAADPKYLVLHEINKSFQPKPAVPKNGVKSYTQWLDEQHAASRTAREEFRVKQEAVDLEKRRQELLRECEREVMLERAQAYVSSGRAEKGKREVVREIWGSFAPAPPAPNKPMTYLQFLLDGQHPGAGQRGEAMKTAQRQTPTTSSWSRTSFSSFFNSSSSSSGGSTTQTPTTGQNIRTPSTSSRSSTPVLTPQSSPTTRPRSPSFASEISYEPASTIYSWASDSDSDNVGIITTTNTTNNNTNTNSTINTNTNSSNNNNDNDNDTIQQARNTPAALLEGLEVEELREVYRSLWRAYLRRQGREEMSLRG